jgi:hypothetical protein
MLTLAWSMRRGEGGGFNDSVLDCKRRSRLGRAPLFSNRVVSARLKKQPIPWPGPRHELAVAFSERTSQRWPKIGVMSRSDGFRPPSMPSKSGNSEPLPFNPIAPGLRSRCGASIRSSRRPPKTAVRIACPAKLASFGASPPPELASFGAAQLPELASFGAFSPPKLGSLGRSADLTGSSVGVMPIASDETPGSAFIATTVGADRPIVWIMPISSLSPFWRALSSISDSRSHRRLLCWPGRSDGVFLLRACHPILAGQHRALRRPRRSVATHRPSPQDRARLDQ